MTLSAVLTSIVVNYALQSHGDEAKEIVMAWGSSLSGSSSTWQSRGDDAAWTSSLDWLVKKLPSTSTLQLSKKVPALPVRCPPETRYFQHLSCRNQRLSQRRFLLNRCSSSRPWRKISMSCDRSWSSLLLRNNRWRKKSRRCKRSSRKQKESLPHSSPAVPVPLRKNERTVAAAQARRWSLRDGGSATLAMAMSMCKVTATSIG